MQLLRNKGRKIGNSSNEIGETNEYHTGAIDLCLLILTVSVEVIYLSAVMSLSKEKTQLKGWKAIWWIKFSGDCFVNYL